MPFSINKRLHEGHRQIFADSAVMASSSTSMRESVRRGPDNPFSAAGKRKDLGSFELMAANPESAQLLLLLMQPQQRVHGRGSREIERAQRLLDRRGRLW